MTASAPRLAAGAAALALWLAAAALPVAAASSTSSAASQGSSASVGSLSTSLEGSSNASSPDGRVADGDYTVIEVADSGTRPGLLRVTMQAAGTTLHLHLPPAVVRDGGVAVGQSVSARQRPFGVEFAAGQPRQAFFLALHEHWMPELQTRAVSL